MATKETFLHFPATDYCTTILSLGEPRSGKTYIMLKCLEYWLRVGLFEKYLLILPSFKNEADGSYDFLLQHENVFIYETFYEHIVRDLLDEQEKNNDLFKKGKLDQKPRYFFAIDDATSQGAGLFKSKDLVKIVTQNRHYNIHSWLLLHYDKGIVAPRIRQNIYFVFLYDVKEFMLKKAYDQYVNFKKDFPNFDTFNEFFDQYVSSQQYGTLLLAGKKKYNPNVCRWFENTEQPKIENEIQKKEIQKNGLKK